MMWPVTGQSEYLERGGVLLDRGRRELTLQFLHESNHVRASRRRSRPCPQLVGPFGEMPCRIEVRLSRIVIVDLHGGKFEHALGRLGRRREQRRGLQLGRRGDDDFGVHGLAPGCC